MAHKVALDLTDRQKTYCAQAAGVARFAYNWALAEWRSQYLAYREDRTLPAPNALAIRRKLNSVKRSDFPWMYDVTKCATHGALADLDAAFQAFFAGRARHPRFKSKDTRAAFHAADEPRHVVVSGKRIRLPVIGWLRLREAPRFTGTIRRVTVTRSGDRWFASLLIALDEPLQRPRIVEPRDVVGVDLGLATFATLSDGELLSAPRPRRRTLNQMRRLSRALSRKRAGSRNRLKAKRRLERLHQRISNVRRDATHKASTQVARSYRRIGIEDLNVRGMARNSHLGRHILDCEFGEFRRQLEYKAKIYGAVVVVADRWYPSSKTCSCCGSVKSDLALKIRTFECADCGVVIDRDRNAALNLERLAAGSAVSACGEERSGARPRSRVKRSSLKQEPSSRSAA